MNIWPNLTGGFLAHPRHTWSCVPSKLSITVQCHLGHRDVIQGGLLTGSHSSSCLALWSSWRVFDSVLRTEFWFMTPEFLESLGSSLAPLSLTQGLPGSLPLLCENFTQMVKVGALASWMSFQINSPSYPWCENLRSRLLGRMHVYRWIHLSRVKWKREGRRCQLHELLMKKFGR